MRFNSQQCVDVRYMTSDSCLLSRGAQADSHRVMTFSNEEDVVFFRHHMYEKRGGKEVTLHEVGPRFEMQLYQLRLGTLDQVRIGLRAASWGDMTQVHNGRIYSFTFFHGAVLAYVAHKGITVYVKRYVSKTLVSYICKVRQIRLTTRIWLRRKNIVGLSSYRAQK